MKTNVNWTVLSVASAVAMASLMTIGCGSLGINKNAIVEIRSLNISQITLIVSPENGAANSTQACTNSLSGFPCSKVFGSDTTEIRFKTNSLASTLPYNVYVRNNSASTVRVTLNLIMDEDLLDSGGYDIAPGGTARIGEVRRTTAQALNL